MRKRKRKHTHKRIWLAPSNPDSMAWASWYNASYNEEGQIDIQIADCHRSITLGLYSKKDEVKIRKLIAFLQGALNYHTTERYDDAED